MSRKIILLLAVVLAIGLVPTPAVADGYPPSSEFTPGAPGIGDPYFPLDGNGGYDVRHYGLDIGYDPATRILTGVDTITARATENLSSFDLDFVGLDIASIRVNGHRATWSRDGQELTVVPWRGLKKHRVFNVVVKYSGTPVANDDVELAGTGYYETDDGMMMLGQPHAAAQWFPVNDHPSDKASYDMRFTVPEGLEAISNGRLLGSTTRNGQTTWKWRQRAPMASYLATVSVGEFDITRYDKNGLEFLDALDPDLSAPIAAPTTGTNFALSGVADAAYKRLVHQLSVPADGAQLTFQVTRQTEESWDYAFVEVHTVGADDWTTLPDLNGHTSTETGNLCRGVLAVSPFLAHYVTPGADETCSPTGTTGAWNGISGAGVGPEEWAVDLGAYAGRDVEISISYATDSSFTMPGVFVDDITSSTGDGTTSFEDDADGWTVPGPPVGTTNADDWFVGTVDELPSTTGDIVRASFAREPEIIQFLSDNFGRYPFRSVGGVVDDMAGVGFALETQSRPVYAREFFTDPTSGDSVVVHELTHQWFGDSVAVAGWKDIWLNEGFASYAEWLWSEHEGLETAQQIFDLSYESHPADDPFWSVVIGDPGPVDLFDGAVYDRGAMTLHQLRLAVGDDAFFTILKTWTSSRGGRNGEISQFIALAEQLSGQDLGALFQTWLYDPVKPVLAASSGAARSAVALPAFSGRGALGQR